MTERTDVCVIGSGFGGAILAYYIAHAGQRVVVLERGPDRPTESLQVDIDPKQLLQITHQFIGNGISILVGTGVGGGSLVYSGASLRAPSFVFERQLESATRIWPRSISRRTLDPYYARVEKGLGTHQIAFGEVAKRGGTWAQRMNALGYRVDPIRQATTNCVHCGFCNVGCKFSRKNALPLNYLRGARLAGAEVRAGQEAIAVMPADGGYRVLYGPTSHSSLVRPTAPSLSGAHVIQARRVVLAGGAIGTAGLLLRSKPFLPNLSAQAGQHLSGNGDLALMALLPEDRRLPGRGRVRQYQGVAMDTVCYEWLASHGFIIITQHELSPATVISGDPSGQWWGLKKKHLMRHYGDTLIGLAVIGVDGSPGQVVAAPLASDETSVTPAFGVSDILFPIDRETQRLWHDARKIVGRLVERMGGELIDVTLNLSPNYGDFAFSAHPVGTARMADGPGIGVVDDVGEVYGHPGLYVTDGAAVPTALGVNPSLTIAALAERCALALVRRLGKRPVAPPVANPFEKRRPGESLAPGVARGRRRAAARPKHKPTSRRPKRRKRLARP